MGLSNSSPSNDAFCLSNSFNELNAKRSVSKSFLSSAVFLSKALSSNFVYFKRSTSSSLKSKRPFSFLTIPA